MTNEGVDADAVPAVRAVAPIATIEVRLRIRMMRRTGKGFGPYRLELAS